VKLADILLDSYGTDVHTARRGEPYSSLHRRQVMSMAKSLGILGLAALVIGATSIGKAQENTPIPSPTAEHRILAAEEGTWDAAIKSYPNGPESEPMVAKGVEINTVMTGGLWVTSVFRADFGGMVLRRPRPVRL
jgi:hypothetical protein